MLTLRLIRGASLTEVLRRLLLMVAAAGSGFLLLSTLGYAAVNPGSAEGGLARLVWCVVPLGATVQLAIALGRTQHSHRTLLGLDAAGMGPSRLPLLVAARAATSCLLGSALALLVFLHLRGDLGGTPLAGAASDLLAGDHSLPVGGVIVLLCLAPVAAAAATGFTLRPRPLPPGGQEGPREDRPEVTVADSAPTSVPPGLPWGAALAATGLALESFALLGGGTPAEGAKALAPLPLPGALDGSPPGVALGWLLTALGLVLAGPGLTHLCGRLVGAGRPGALRLLAGRGLQDEARHIGRPVGVLCAVASGVLAAVELRQGAQAAEARVFGPLTLLGGVLVVCCVTASAVTAATESRAVRATATGALLRLGAPRALLRGAAALRAVALLVVLTAVTGAVAYLAAFPLDSLSG